MTSVGAQFRQLPMFMSAREIRSQYVPWDNDREWVDHRGDWETDEEVWGRKLSEARESGLDRDVVSHGVRNPVPLEHVDPWWHGNRTPQLMGGQHRVAVMSQERPDDLMPVEHFEDFKDVKRADRAREDAEVREMVRSRRSR